MSSLRGARSPHATAVARPRSGADPAKSYGSDSPGVMSAM
ncbi:hypothetical protein K378_03388 [Streptomyces sp. Amel2xB2]|nr:hypothetical protein K378_03388 [Streptomyces sp. Amel2xB2]